MTEKLSLSKRVAEKEAAVANLVHVIRHELSTLVLKTRQTKLSSNSQDVDNILCRQTVADDNGTLAL